MKTEQSTAVTYAGLTYEEERPADLTAHKAARRRKVHRHPHPGEGSEAFDSTVLKTHIHNASGGGAQLWDLYGAAAAAAGNLSLSQCVRLFALLEDDVMASPPIDRSQL